MIIGIVVKFDPWAGFSKFNFGMIELSCNFSACSLMSFINVDCMLSYRRQSYEGLALKQIHLEQVTSLVRRCRRFFPSTAAVEIWNEFRYNLIFGSFCS